MPTTSFKSGKLTFDFSPGTAVKAAPRDPDAPLHILIMGDFSGGSNTTERSHKPLPVDCDNFDDVMRSLKPVCRVAAGGRTPELSPSTLDDFHPDHLLRAIEPLVDQPPAAGAASESNTDLIGRLMGNPPPSPAPAAPKKVDIAALLKSAVGANAVVANPVEQAARAASDLNHTTALRSVLHYPAFQRLEANWRSVDMLMRAFGAEESVRFSLLDCNFESFAGEFASPDDLQATRLFQLLGKRASDERFAVVLGLYTFNPSAGDLHVLSGAAKICSAQAATFVSAASPRFVGCDSFSGDVQCTSLSAEAQTRWEEFRAAPEANRIALALPRFLIRQPYSASSDPIEAFAFEELTPQLVHEDFLWANPAILCAYALIEAFLAEGWQASTEGFAEVAELPVYRFQENGENKVKPCAETWMPESTAEKISAQGLIPILSIKGRDAVRIDGLRSVSATNPAVPL
jgi:type VI secretion system protein ImpC